MKIPKKHGPTIFLVVMVFIMVVFMTLVLGFVNGTWRDGFLRVWPRQFLIAFAVALPAAFIARKLATMAAAKLTE